MAGWGIDFGRMIGALGGMLGEAVTIAGTSYPAIVSQGANGEDATLEGMFADKSITATIRTAYLATPPALGSRITARGVVYRVDRVERHAHGDSFKLSCVEAD